MTFGEQLRRWRRERFLTQKVLAEQLGVTWQTIARWEGEKGVPYPATQRRLIEVLGVEPAELFAALDATEAARGKERAAA